MGVTARGRHPFNTRVRSANDRWKGRWSSWLALSMVAGAVAHAIVFAVWPVWQLTATRSEPRSEMVQLEPVITAGAVTDPGEEVISAAPREQETELEITEMGEGGDLELEEMFEIFGTPNPSVTTPILPRTAFGRRGAPLPPLNLEHVQPLSPHIALTGPRVQLPVIRNPTVLQRFLRMRYNPLHEEPGSNVSVAMWVDERGSVEWAEVSDSSGHPMVDDIALAIFNEVIVFTPARVQGSRVPVSLVITVPFTALW